MPRENSVPACHHDSIRQCRPQVQGIVAAADPSSDSFVATLDAAAAAAPEGMLKGIRWILNYDGELQVQEPTPNRRGRGSSAPCFRSYSQQLLGADALAPRGLGCGPGLQFGTPAAFTTR